jgi:lipopolysaccharide biosynthesis regulator YciM
LRFLLALHDQHPDDLEILSDLLRCHARLGDRTKAVATLDDIATKAPRDVTVRLALGDALYQSGDYELANLAYGQVLQIDAANGLALVGTARLHLQLFEPQQAHRILESLKPAPNVERIYRLTWAEYHQLVGEQVEALHIYHEFLERDPTDYEARLALAAVDEYLREYEKAKAEYSKIPPDVTLGRKARLGIASTLTAQRLFPQAIAFCQELLTQNPGNGNAAAQLVRTLGKATHFDEAIAAARAFLEANPRNEPALFSVRLALGRVLLDAGKDLDAVRAYEKILEHPANRIPATVYGLARAWRKLGQPAKAQDILGTLLSYTGGDTRNRLLFADLFAEDNEDQPAVEMCEAVLRVDPQNLAALIRLASSQQRLDRFTGQIDDAVQTCKTILALSPTNIQARLALARSLSTAQDYPAAVEEYNRLLALLPTFTVAGREKARVLFSDHQFAASAAAYAQMQTPSADAMLHNDLAALAARESQLGTILQPLLRAGPPPPALRAEAAKLMASSDTTARASLDSALRDYEARAAEQAGAALEGEAKSKKDFRNWQAIPVYKNLIAAEPANTEAIFDLGGVYGALRQTQKELPEYAEVLQVEPQHREAQIADERASLELAPQLRMGIDFVSENGRGMLARIDRTLFGPTVILPYADEDEFISVGYRHAFYQPHDDRGLDGNILSLRGQVKCPEQLLLYSQINFEEFRDRLHDRVTYDTGAIYECCNSLHLRLSSFLENVVENGETLRQDIYRVGINAGADYRPTRIWAFGGNYRNAIYSDDNDLNEFYLFNEVELHPPPCQLKFVVDADYMAFAHQTIFNAGNPDTLMGVIYPYFSPSGFLYYEARIEWTQWISRDYFVHSNQCYYSLQYALGFDDRLRGYNVFRVLFNFDLKPWLTVGADAQQTLSPDYDATTAMAFVLIRLPCHLCH